MKKIFTLFAALTFAVAMSAQTTIYSWNGNANTSSANETGGTATAKGGDSNVVAGSKQKNNWCYKLGKTYTVDNVQTHYVEIALNEALTGGEEIEISAFLTSTGKTFTIGVDFDGDNELTFDPTEVITDNGAPTTSQKLTVPAEAAGKDKIRVYRKTGNTTGYVSLFVVTSGTTGVSKNEIKSEASATYFNLNGQAVNPATFKGVAVTEGKKVVLK